MHTVRPHVLDGPGQTPVRICDFCGQAIAPRSVIGSLVPDSSVVDEFDPGCDGWRPVTVCCSEHLHLLTDRGRAAWVDEQLWLGRLSRAGTQPGLHHAGLTALARRAALTPEQLQQLLTWNANRPASVSSLPTGQSLMPSDRTSDEG